MSHDLERVDAVRRGPKRRRSRHRPRTFLLATLLAVVAGLVVAGCGGEDAAAPAVAPSEPSAPAEPAEPAAPPEEPAEAEPVRILYLGGVVQNSYVQEVLKKANEVAARENATIDVVDAAFDVNKQIAQCQDALAAGGYDAIITLPVDSGVIPCIEDAIAQGIKVVSHNFVLGDDYTTAEPQLEGQSGVVIRVTTLDGQARGDMVVKACEGIDPCEVAIIEGVLATTLGRVRLDATKEVFADHPNITVVAEAEGGFSRDDSLAVTQDLLQAHPDLDVVATGGDQGALGAEQAVLSAGRTVGVGPDDVKIIGVAASIPGVQAVKEGRWYGTTTWLPHLEGELIAELAIKAVRGEPIEDPGVDEVEYSGLPPYYSAETMDQFPADFVGEWPG